MRLKPSTVGTAVLLTLASACQAFAASQTPEPTKPSAAINPFLEARLRYEEVDQTKTATLRENAEALTLRTRFGFETASWNNLKGLVEFEDVRQVGPDNYAVNVPGAATAPLNGADKSKYPLVNDPQVTELNRLQVTWTPNKAATVTLGRQRILLDDQRFVGNSGWRQDEQTFDALRLDTKYGKFKATYAYVTRINRILGEERDWAADAQLLNATWAPAEALWVQSFVYALDFRNSPINSSITKGVKFSGKTKTGAYKWAYNATYAQQSDYRSNSSPFELDYMGFDLAGTYDIYTAKLSYESLEGNGTRGFTTPLASSHPFQGWADAWVSPGGNKGFVDGLEDLNLTINVKPKLKLTHLFNIDLTARRHDFNDQRTGADLATEWDLQALAFVTPKLSVALKYADFQREGSVPKGTATPPPSRTKVWVVLEYKL